MRRNLNLITMTFAVAAFGAGLHLNGNNDGAWSEQSIVSTAEARVGRPLTPVSYAGVARRTTRRVVRRSTIYIAALPVGCVTVSINGAGYWLCGATYYQSSGGRYVVVYIN